VVYTLLVALNSLPKVALAQLIVIWLGTGIEPKIAVAVMLGLLGTVLFYLVECAEGLLVPWHPSHRARHGNARG
jgi:ABC-type nitrate/sulfonate/bicarbonate transport system permease component